MTVVTDVVSFLNFEGSNKGIRIVDFAFDGAYPAGGEAITPGDVQLSTIDFAVAVNNAISDFQVQYLPATGKLAAVVISTAAEAGAAAVGSLVSRMLVIGTKEANA